MAKRVINAKAELAIIGGSGLYEMDGFDRVREVVVRTPFGDPSDKVIVGSLGDVRVAFLARHGRGHRLSPSDINYRANIYALKSLGVTRILSVSAVGSMKESIVPGHVVVPRQFIDLTKRRSGTFFDCGIVAHIAFAEPICSQLSGIISRAARKVGAAVHDGGVYVCMEGPQFSTKAESLLYRTWGVDVIGMTNMPEAKLAREAEMCYATLAMPTDYDCWHETLEPVSVETILATMRQNTEKAKLILKEAAERVPELTGCPCQDALNNAILTDPRKITPTMRRRLQLLIGRYVSAVRKGG